MNNHTHHNDGPALAAIMAAAIGCAVIGLATVLTEASPVIKETLNWWSPAGPLTGKTGVGIIAWLLAWLGLHLSWEGKELSFSRVCTWAMRLILIGWIGTFPPFFELFAVHP